MADKRVLAISAKQLSVSIFEATGDVLIHLALDTGAAGSPPMPEVALRLSASDARKVAAALIQKAAEVEGPLLRH